MNKKYLLRLYPDSILRKKSHVVKNIDGVIDELIDCMSEMMYSNKAIGLAAPQVGVLKRVIVADVGEGLVHIINPEIIKFSDKEKLEEECLSIFTVPLAIT